MIATLELVDIISYHKSIKGPELEGDEPARHRRVRKAAPTYKL